MYANSKCPDIPVNPRSLIRTFADSKQKSLDTVEFVNKDACDHAHYDLNLSSLHILKVTVLLMVNNFRVLTKETTFVTY